MNEITYSSLEISKNSFLTYLIKASLSRNRKLYWIISLLSFLLLIFGPGQSIISFFDQSISLFVQFLFSIIVVSQLKLVGHFHILQPQLFQSVYIRNKILNGGISIFKYMLTIMECSNLFWRIVLMMLVEMPLSVLIKSSKSTTYSAELVETVVIPI